MGPPFCFKRQIAAAGSEGRAALVNAFLFLFVEEGTERRQIHTERDTIPSERQRNLIQGTETPRDKAYNGDTRRQGP